MINTNAGTIKLIYIAGYGRSGSTILDLLLGRNRRLLGLGEFTNFSECLDENDPCSCGQGIRDCPFWSRVIEVVRPAKDERTSFGVGAIAQISNTLSFLLRRRLNEADQAIAQYNKRLVEQALKITGKNIAIDSSKSFGRLYALVQSRFFDIKIIHLLRDGRGVGFSRMKKREIRIMRDLERKKPKTMSYTTRRWAFNNAMVFISALLLRDRYLMVRYEDLCEDPERTWSRILSFIGIEEEPEGTQMVCHNIGGNNVRFQNIEKLTVDNSWKEGLSVRDRISFALNLGHVIHGIADCISGSTGSMRGEKKRVRS